MKPITIKDIEVFNTSITGRNNTIVKVKTSEDGLFGLGCASFTQRYEAVTFYIQKYLKPLLIDRDVSEISDLWKLMNLNAYWRNGGIENNAISGIDMALWDIKGKVAGLPLYDLFGGKVRRGAEIYSGAFGYTLEELDRSIENMLAAGYKTIRIAYKDSGRGRDEEIKTAEGAPFGRYYNPRQYHFDMVEAFDHVRSKFGYDVKLITDVHGKISTTEAMSLCKALEKYDLFFIEDPIKPEDAHYFKDLRRHTHIPIGMGELFNNPAEYNRLIAEKDIDYLRCHVSQIGGITPALKLAHYAEPFGIKTVWHGPTDTSPIGHTAQNHINLAIENFGVQEFSGTIRERAAEVSQAFPGMAYDKDGYLYCTDKPGIGVDFDELAAKEYPPEDVVLKWTQARLPDGSLGHP